jgi:hypothetical protein
MGLKDWLSGLLDPWHDFRYRTRHHKMAWHYTDALAEQALAIIPISVVQVSVSCHDARKVQAASSLP